MIDKTSTAKDIHFLKDPQFGTTTVLAGTITGLTGGVTTGLAGTATGLTVTGVGFAIGWAVGLATRLRARAQLERVKVDHV